MEMVTESLTPAVISNNLVTVDGMLSKLDTATEEEVRMMRKIVRRAADNVDLLFSLSADPDSGEFVLKNVGQAWMLADILYRGSLVPSSYNKPEQVVIALMKCTEIRVSPITGLSNMMVVNNRVSVWGDLGQALAQRSGLWVDHSAEEIGEKSAPGLPLDEWPADYGWRFTATRKGHETPFVGEYTVADAKRANLWGNTKKLPWITDPSRMIFNRARARPIRDGFSDCLFGMALIEEQQDFAPLEAVRITGPTASLAHSPDDEPVTEESKVEATMPDYSGRAEPDQPVAE